MNIIKQKVRNLLFSIQTTGTAKHLVHIRINKQSAPVIGYANRAYSSLVYSRPFSEMPKQNWRFCCSGNPKIHVIVSRKSFQTYTTKLLQKSEMRKNMVMDLIYRGFIYAANYSESHYNPCRSQIKTELRYLFVTTLNR